MICELVSDEPRTNGDGLLASQGGVEELGPGPPRAVGGRVLSRAQHPHTRDWGGRPADWPSSPEGEILRHLIERRQSDLETSEQRGETGERDETEEETGPEPAVAQTSQRRLQQCDGCQPDTLQFNSYI